MSKAKIEGKYWYFRFSENIFDYDMLAMEQEPGGYEFEIILFKLYAVSLKKNGVIPISLDSNGKMELYTLCEWIHHKIPIVERALEYFVAHGYMEILRSAEYESILLNFPGVKNRIGCSSKEADDRRERRKRGETDAALPEQLSLPTNTTENEGRESEAEEKLEFGVFKNVRLTKAEYAEATKRFANADTIINRISLYKKQHGKTYEDDYAAFLRFAETDGEKRVPESDKRKKEYERFKREALQGFPPPSNAKDFLTAMQIAELERIAEEHMEE